MRSHSMNRRQSLRSLGAASLALAFSTMAGAEQPVDSTQIGAWLDRLDRNARLLDGKKISSLQWQEAMDVIYGDVSVTALKERLDFESLRKEILEAMEPERGEMFGNVLLPGSDVQSVEGAEPRRALIVKVAHVRKGRSIPPHGHSNMVSAFLCISGEFAVRQYDKLEENEKTMVVRQTVDEPSAGVGTWSSISDYRNNVHWLTAKTDDCYLFTCKLMDLETGRPMHGRVNIDVREAETLGTATFRVPKITHSEAANRY